MNIDFFYINNLQKIISLVEDCGGVTPIISGGAVRDHLLNKPIKDIDVFYQGELDKEKVYKAFKVETEFTIDDLDDYDSSAFKVPFPKVSCLSLTEYPIQLIQVEDVGKLWDDGFACNINQVAVNKGGLIITNEFLKDVELEILSFADEINEDYIDRLCNKYQEYS